MRRTALIVAVLGFGLFAGQVSTAAQAGGNGATPSKSGDGLIQPQPMPPTDMTPDGKPVAWGLPEQVRELLQQAMQERRQFMEQQKELLKQWREATDEEKEKIREQLRQNREQFLQQMEQLRAQIRQRVEELRQEFKSKREELLQRIRDRVEERRGRRGRGGE